MTNLDLIAYIRQAGKRPTAVHIHHVQAIDTFAWPMSRGGIVTCEIAATEGLSALDLRPLHRLNVSLHDFTDDTERYRRLAALVAAQDPERLTMSVRESDGSWTVHQRRSGETVSNETTQLGAAWN